MKAAISSITTIPSVPSIISRWMFVAPAIGLRIAGTDLSYGAFVLLAVHAARGGAQAIQSLILSWLFVSLNSEILPPVGDVELIRLLILVVAAVRAVMEVPKLSRLMPLSSIMLPLLFFIMFCLVNSMLVSQLPLVSILKSVLFGLMAFTTLVLWNTLGFWWPILERWFFRCLAAVAVVSAPLPLLGMGYERNSVGFQGILSQPQGFGIVMALLTTWQLSSMMAKYRFSAIDILQFTFFAILLYMSLSRTGMLAFALGMIAAGLISLLSRRIDLKSVVAGSWRLAGIGGLLIVAIASSQGVTQAFVHALLKDDDVTIEESFEGSRGLLIEASLEKFQERPVLGNGFGVPTYFDDYEIRYDPVFGLPISAPVEKGVLPIAVLEELGVVGGIFFIWLILALLQAGARYGRFNMIALLACALAINLGEAVLFSAGGYGLVIWLGIGMTVGSAVSGRTHVIHHPRSW